MRSYKDFHFHGQKKNEQILLVARRHWFDILIQFFIIFMMILVLASTSVLLPMFFSAIEPGGEARMAFIFFESLFTMLIWIIFYLIWIDYYFDVWIVTDKRIVNVEQKGLFSREVSELELENIQDITTDVKGIIPTFLNYGDVYIQTAAEKERFLFHNVPNPYAIKDLVMNLQKRQEKQEASDLGAMIRKEIHEK